MPYRWLVTRRPIAKAVHFHGHNVHEVMTAFPGRVRVVSGLFRLKLRVLVAPGGAIQTVTPDHWLVMDGDVITVLTPAEFRALVEEYA